MAACQYGVGGDGRPAGAIRPRGGVWRGSGQASTGAWAGGGMPCSGWARRCCAGGPVTSLPRLSLLPALGRGHGSVYAALAEGRIDAGGLRDLLVAYRLAGWPLVFAVDGTSWPRCDAETSPQRGYYYHPSRHSAGKPIVARGISRSAS